MNSTFSGGTSTSGTSINFWGGLAWGEDNFPHAQRYSGSTGI